MQQVDVLPGLDYPINTTSMIELDCVGMLSDAYRSILFQRAQFMEFAEGEKLASRNEQKYMVFLVRGAAILYQGLNQLMIDENYHKPVFTDATSDVLLFTEKSCIVRFDRQLYQMLNNSSILYTMS